MGASLLALAKSIYYWVNTLESNNYIDVYIMWVTLEALFPNLHCTIKGLFTWSGGPRSSGVGFFCFHALEDTKQKNLTPLDQGPPPHVNRV